MSSPNYSNSTKKWNVYVSSTINSKAFPWLTFIVHSVCSLSTSFNNHLLHLTRYLRVQSLPRLTLAYSFAVNVNTEQLPLLTWLIDYNFFPFFSLSQHLACLTRLSLLRDKFTVYLSRLKHPARIWWNYGNFYGNDNCCTEDKLKESTD